MESWGEWTACYIDGLRYRFRSCGGEYCKATDEGYEKETCELSDTKTIKGLRKPGKGC